ncbi:MAG: rhodanese-like domain-containing protein [Planctomycetota bacterium]
MSNHDATTSKPACPDIDDRGLPAGYPFKPAYEVCPSSARTMLADGQAILVDVRLAEEREIATLPGGHDEIHAPLHELNDHLDDIEDLARGRTILTFCHHGIRSIKAALALRGCGMDDSHSIAGGIDVWSMGVDTSVPRYTRDGAQCQVVPAGSPQGA